MNDERKLHPGASFASPEAVLEDRTLSRQDKIEVLNNWANELRQLQVAEEENMAGRPGAGEQLAAVERALLALGEDGLAHDAKA